MAEEDTESALPVGEFDICDEGARKRNKSRMSNMVLLTKIWLPRLKFWHALQKKVRN